MSQTSHRARRFLGDVRGRLLVLMLAMLGPAFALAAWSVLAHRTEATERALHETRTLARVLAHDSARSIEDARHLLANLGQRPDVIDDDSPACGDELREVLRALPAFVNIAVAGPDGAVACSAVPTSRLVVAARGAFDDAVDTGRVAVGDFVAGDGADGYVPVALPVADGGRIRKVLVAGIRQATFEDHLAHIAEPDVHGAFVVDRRGVVLARRPHGHGWLGRSAAAVPVVRAALDGHGDGTVIADGLDGIRRLYGFAPISAGTDRTVHGYVIVGVPEAAAFASAQALLTRNMLALAAAALGTFGLGLVLAKSLIVDRLDRLRHMTHRLAAGDLSARVGPPYGSGDIGRLAHGFDRMAELLEQREADLVVSNERFRLVAEATNDVVWEWNLVTDEGWWGSGAQALFGWAPEAVRAGTKWWLERVHPDDQDTVGRTIQRVIDQGGTSWTAEYRFQRADGSYADVLDRGSVMRAADGAPRRMVGAMLDLSERKRAEEERRLQQAALLKSEKLAALGQLAAGVAHELRNPLAVIAARAAVMQRKAQAAQPLEPEAVRAGAASLQEAAERMQRIVASLSMYSKPSRPEPTPLKLDELLTATREIVAYEARQANVAVAVEVGPGASCAFGDRSQMMQILVNLATNAVQAMAEQGGTLTLRANAEPWGGTAIEVIDTGPGMAPDVLARIWDAFYTTKPEGTGLGLSIVRSLVEAQPGASIGVHSTPGQGTRFTLRMPCGAAGEGSNSAG